MDSSTKRIEYLERLIADLGARATMEPDQGSGLPEDIPAASPMQPYWTTISIPERPITPGDDWEPVFYDLSISPRVVSRRITAGGELVVGDANNRSFLARIAFRSTSAGIVTGWIGGADFSRVQIKVNGHTQELASRGFVGIPVREGTNELVVMTEGAQTLDFDVLLLKFPHATWIVPEGSENRGNI